MSQRKKRILIQKTETLCRLLDERLDLEIFSNPVLCWILSFRGFGNFPLVDTTKLVEKTAFIKQLIEDIIEITDTTATTEEETFAFAQKLFGGEELCSQ